MLPKLTKENKNKQKYTKPKFERVWVFCLFLLKIYRKTTATYLKRFLLFVKILKTTKYKTNLKKFTNFKFSFFETKN